MDGRLGFYGILSKQIAAISYASGSLKFINKKSFSGSMRWIKWGPGGARPEIQIQSAVVISIFHTALAGWQS